MSNLVEDFISSPSEAVLDSCTKDQFKIADHYGIEIGDRRVKDSTVIETLKTKLIEESILVEMPATAGQLKPQISSLTFQQQERLMLLQIEQERVKLEVECEN